MAKELGTPFRKGVKVQIWEEQGGLCTLCGRKCRRHAGNKADDAFTVDHIVPKRLGGQGNKENGRGLCAKCHRRRNRGEITLDGRPKGPRNKRRSR